MVKYLLITSVIFVGACSTNCGQKIQIANEAIIEGYEQIGMAADNRLIDYETGEKAVKSLDLADEAITQATPLCLMGNPGTNEYLTQAGEFIKQSGAILEGDIND